MISRMLKKEKKILIHLRSWSRMLTLSCVLKILFLGIKLLIRRITNSTNCWVIIGRGLMFMKRSALRDSKRLKKYAGSLRKSISWMINSRNWKQTLPIFSSRFQNKNLLRLLRESHILTSRDWMRRLKYKISETARQSLSLLHCRNRKGMLS